MKTGVLIALNKFTIQNADTPIPESNEVLIKVMACGICGSDIHKMQTQWNYGFPKVIGHEFSGEVVEIGSNVKKFNVGDRVTVAPLIPCMECEYCREGKFQLCDHYQMIGTHRMGGFSQFTTVPESNLIKIPDSISFEEAAMVEPLAVAAHGIMGLNPQIGDTVAIFGLGTIGLLTVQWLRLAGIKRIIGIDIDNEKLKSAQFYGVTDVINTREMDLESKISELTDGQGVDISIECAGSKITEEQCLLITKKAGKIGYQGIAYTDVLLQRKAFENIFRREYTVKGFWNSYSAPFPGKEWFHSISFIEQNKFNLTQMISHKFDLQDLQTAFDIAVNRTELYNKIMIYPNGVN